MIILLIVILQLISTALWVTSSGLVVQRKIRNRVNALANTASGKVTAVNNKFADESGISMSGVNSIKSGGDKVRNLGNNALNMSNKVAVTAIRMARTVINLIKSGLMALLPLVLVLDIIIFAIISAVGGGFLAILNALDDGTFSLSTTTGTTVGTGSTDGGTGDVILGQSSDIILVGDSRVFGWATVVEGLSQTAGDEYIGAKGDDYIICHGGKGIDFFTQQKSTIEAQLGEGSAVVFELGINGCAPNSGETVATFAERYGKQIADMLNTAADEWADKGVKVYFMSINPVNDEKCASANYTLKNEYVTAVNTKVKGKLKDGVGYIDTYSKVSAKVLAGEGLTYSNDGLHYDPVLYTTIFDYVWQVVKGG